MFRRSGIFEQNMTLSDIENLLPYEMIIYASHIMKTIKDYKIRQQQTGSG